jgi:hypothetical protein
VKFEMLSAWGEDLPLTDTAALLASSKTFVTTPGHVRPVQGLQKLYKGRWANDLIDFHEVG